jgi:hypothetical protein
LIGVAVVLLLLVGLVVEVITTRPVRQAMRNYTALIAAANRQDLEAIQRLCSARYLSTDAPRAAAEGGVVGLPRNIHKNFQAWRHEANVWICPTNRVGPIYQFVFEQGDWRFDGPIGFLYPRGQVVPLGDLQGPPGTAAVDDAATIENPE